MSEIKLKPCPFCGDEKDLQILNTGDLVGWTCHYDCDKQIDTISKLNNQWFVNCPTCGACGPMYYVGGEFGEADCEICKAKAIEGWNRRGDKITVGEYAPVVHAYWKDRTGQDPYCSNCGFSYEREQGGSAQITDYCGNCGAKMDGEEHNNV